jgi:hypothetical protein
MIAGDKVGQMVELGHSDARGSFGGSNDLVRVVLEQQQSDSGSCVKIAEHFPSRFEIEIGLTGHLFQHSAHETELAECCEMHYQKILVRKLRKAKRLFDEPGSAGVTGGIAIDILNRRV